MVSENWHWIPSSEYGGAAGNAVTKLFRGNDLSAAELLSREVIQNSWDAAQEFRHDPEHQFWVKFRFATVQGAELENLRSALGVRELTTHLERAETTDQVPQGGFLSNSDHAKVLYIEDHGAHGLHGHPRLKTKSHLYKALYILGDTGKAQEAGGGSFGFGKSAFIRASSSHTVVAYSCFAPQAEDAVTRRLVGFTWWGPHQMDREGIVEQFEGRAIFGEFHRGGTGRDVHVYPYEDKVADEFASNLGIELRQPGNLDERGTTLLLLDPNVEPSELLEAIELNWWPAIVDDLIRVEVETEDGEIFHPKPKLRSSLKDFIRSYEIATRPNDAPLGDDERLAVQTHRDHGVYGKIALKARQVSDGSGDEESLKPQIALVRHPRMVIRYFDAFQAKRVQVRGTYVVNDDNSTIDRYLKNTEPASHDDWVETPSEDIPLESTNVARLVTKFVREEVNAFAKKFIPESKSGKQELAQFSALLSKFFGTPSGAPLPPPNGGLPVSINIKKPRLVPVLPDQIAVETKFSLTAQSGLSKKVGEALALRVRLVVLEDESISKTAVSLEVFDNSNKALRPNKQGDFVINLIDAPKCDFSVKSSAYDANLTTKLMIELGQVEDVD